MKEQNNEKEYKTNKRRKEGYKYIRGKRKMNVKEIVRKYLEDNGYDGLCKPFSNKCNCFLKKFKIETSNWEREFMDSDKCWPLACKPGYLVDTKFGPCIVERKEGGE